jgi:hypothetical protein
MSEAGPGQGRFQRAERAIVLPGLTPASARAVLMSRDASLLLPGTLTSDRNGARQDSLGDAR